MSKKKILVVMAVSWFMAVSLAYALGQSYSDGNEDPSKKVLKEGVLGAATGAIASSASGGKAGKGALIGAGTNVIGGALLDTLTSSSNQRQPAPLYAQPQYHYQQPNAGYYGEQQAYYQPAPVYYAQPPQQDPSKQILKQGLLGAATGAVASSASGGKAGKGALIGAGTNVIGGALLDTLTTPSRPAAQPVYYPPAQPQYNQPAQPQHNQQAERRITRKFDAEGRVVSEEEVIR